MPINKIGGGTNLNPALPMALAPGEVFLLPAGQGILGTFNALSGNTKFTGSTLTGQYIITYGYYSNLQMYDSGFQNWRDLDVTPGTPYLISADGSNYRVVNTTGCPVGALITNAGSGLTNGYNTVTVTPSAGGSTWNTIVGGSINTTITITSGGSSYTKPPLLAFVIPPNQGNTPYILPTAVCTISAGAINTVTVTHQGAGLVAAPTIQVIPQLGDTTGGNAVLTVNATLANSGTLVWMGPATYGTAVTAVPTFTFSPASTIAATAIMNFTITSFTTGTAGVGYTNAGTLLGGGVVSGTAAATNPYYDKGLSIPVWPPLNTAATTGVPTLAGPFGGVNIQAVPTVQTTNAGAAPSTAGVYTANVGGANDMVVLQSI